jgi:hypothetical protein
MGNYFNGTYTAPGTQNTYEGRPGGYGWPISWDWFGMTTTDQVYAGRGNMTVDQRVSFLRAVRSGKKGVQEHKVEGLEGPQNKISQSGAPYSSENNNSRKLDFKGNYNI